MVQIAGENLRGKLGQAETPSSEQRNIPKRNFKPIFTGEALRGDENTIASDYSRAILESLAVTLYGTFVNQMKT